MLGQACVEGVESGLDLIGDPIECTPSTNSNVKCDVAHLPKKRKYEHTKSYINEKVDQENIKVFTISFVILRIHLTFFFRTITRKILSLCCASSTT